MRYLIAGSRTFKTRVVINRVMWDLYLHWLDDTNSGRSGSLLRFASGSAKGADTLAREFFHADIMADARQLGIERRLEFSEYPADWNTHGKGAGPIRNQQMLDEFQPEYVFIFLDKSLHQSAGSRDLWGRATRHPSVEITFTISAYAQTIATFKRNGTKTRHQVTFGLTPDRGWMEPAPEPATSGYVPFVQDPSNG